MFPLAISCLTISSFPWFMNLTFQFLCNIALYSIKLCSHHLSHPQLGVVFALILSLFFLELFFHWSPVAYWAPTDMGSSTFSIIHFCLLILFMGFSRQEYWSGLAFPSPVDHVWSEIPTITCLSWVALQGMAHSCIELDKAVVHVIRSVSVLRLWFSFCLPSDGEGWEAYGSFLMGETDWGGNWILFWSCSVNL